MNDEPFLGNCRCVDMSLLSFKDVHGFVHAGGLYCLWPPALSSTACCPSVGRRSVANVQLF